MESVVDEGSVIATTCSSIINAHAWMRQIAFFDEYSHRFEVIYKVKP